MIQLIRSRFGRQRYRAGIKVPNQLKDMSTSPIVKLEIDSFYEKRREGAPMIPLSQTLKSDYIPIKQKARKEIDRKKLGGMVKSSYNQMISNMKDDITLNTIKNKKQFMELGTRDSIQNIINHEEWSKFKKELFYKKETNRLLKAAQRNPLNHLPSNQSESSLRLQTHLQNQRTLANIKIENLLQASKPNEELAAIIKHQLEPAEGQLPNKQTDKNVELYVAEQRVSNLSKVIGIMETREGYKHWLMEDKYRHLSYQVKGRLSFQNFTDQQFHRYLWFDVKQPGEALHAVSTNNLTLPQMAQAFIRLTSFEIQPAEATRMHTTIPFRNLLKTIFTQLDRHSTQTLCELIHSLGKALEQNQGLQWPQTMSKVLDSIKREIGQRQFTVNEISMILTGLKKLPIQMELALQETILNVIHLSLQADLYVLQEIAQFLAGTSLKTARLQEALTTSISMILSHQIQDWHPHTLVVIVRSITKLLQTTKHYSLKQFSFHLRALSNSIFEALSLEELVELTALMQGHSICAEKVVVELIKNVYRKIKLRDKQLSPQKLIKAIVSLAQLQIKRTPNHIGTYHAVYLPNSTQFLPFLSASNYLLLQQNVNQIPTIWLAKLFLSLSKLMLPNQELMDSIANLLLQRSQLAKKAQRWACLSAVCEGYSCLMRMPSSLQEIISRIQKNAFQLTVDRLINPYHILQIVKALPILFQPHQFNSFLDEFITIAKNLLQHCSLSDRLAVNLSIHLLGRPLPFHILSIPSTSIENMHYHLIQGNKQHIIATHSDLLEKAVQLYDQMQPSSGELCSFRNVRKQVNERMKGEGQESRCIGPFVVGEKWCVMIVSWGMLIKSGEQRWRVDPFWQKMHKVFGGGLERQVVFAPEWGT